jgi:trehalose 6-phosphate synthase
MNENNQDMGRLLVASNRGPVSFSQDADGTLTAKRGGGGVVSGLTSVAGSADLLWICAAMSDADRAAARRAPGGRLDLDGHDAPAKVQMLDIPPDTFAAAYNSVANSTLWFISHLLYDTPNKPAFDAAFARQWGAYREYNTAFALALAESAGRADGAGHTDEAGHAERAGHAAGAGVRAMVQDYHLALVPGMLARLRPGIQIAHFSHTPWAPPGYFRILPDPVARELLEGMLGADHAGFLTARWADAFMDCCADVLGAEVDRAARQISYQDHLCTVGVHPLGVDAAELTHRSRAADVEAHVQTLTEATKGRKLIVRVDRTELSKNIVRGLAAYRELLATHPELHGEVTHLAFAYPSRHDLPEYRAYTDSVQRIARQITEEFGTPDWDPLILEVKDDYARSLAAYRLADVIVVNPIRDGMNLVAKEAPIVSDRGCALVLSREAGACAELGGDALVVNPYDVTATARAMYEGLTMPQAERDRRCAALGKAGAAVPPAQWLASQLTALG